MVEDVGVTKLFDIGGNVKTIIVDNNAKSMDDDDLKATMVYFVLLRVWIVVFVRLQSCNVSLLVHKRRDLSSCRRDNRYLLYCFVH